MKIELIDGKTAVVFENIGEHCIIKNSDGAMVVQNEKAGMTITMNPIVTAQELIGQINKATENFMEVSKEEIIKICDTWFKLFEEIFESYYLLSEETYNQSKIYIKFITDEDKYEKIAIRMSLEEEESQYSMQLRIPDCNIGAYLMLKVFSFLQESFEEEFTLEEGEYIATVDSIERVILHIQDEYYGFKQLMMILYVSCLNSLQVDRDRACFILMNCRELIKSQTIGIPFREDIENAINHQKQLKEKIKQLYLKEN